MNASAVAANRLSKLTPGAVLRSSVTERLLRLMLRNIADMPARWLPRDLT